MSEQDLSRKMAMQQRFAEPSERELAVLLKRKFESGGEETNTVIKAEDEPQPEG